jgi:phosphoesterase RecJ-like protein
MLDSVFTKKRLEEVKNELKKAKRIVVLAHKSPDGDSIGSSTAMARFLIKKGFEVSICHPDSAPEFLTWMNGASKIITFQEQESEVKSVIEKSDLIFCLDFNVLSRLGKEMGEFVKQLKIPKVLIDHHLKPSEEFDIQFSDTSSCSTAQLIYEFINALDDKDLIDTEIGESIYCGIMTDTGSFRFASTSAQTHRIIAELLDIGVKGYLVHEKIFDTNSLERIKLRAFALNDKLEVLKDIQTVIISLSEKELESYDYQQGDTEGLVNVGLSITGINKSIFLKEMNGVVKMSFRSKGKENAVNEFAQSYFEGGGHANAAGGIFKGDLNTALEKLKKHLVEEYG